MSWNWDDQEHFARTQPRKWTHWCIIDTVLVVTAALALLALYFWPDYPR